jgi:hypothetical protein
VKATTRELVVPILVAIVALLFWDTILVYPLRLFVVFLHEISHGLAAVATGGRIVRIELTSAEGGACVTQGGWRFVVLNAGYLGSLAWGVLFLLLAGRTKRDREIVAGIGAFLVVVTLLYVRTLFGFAYGLVFGAALVLVAWKLPSWSDTLLKTIGVVSCLYGVWDVFSDVFFRSARGSDAGALGRLTGIPAVVWGALWVVLDVAVVVMALRVATRSRARPALPA